MYEDDEEHPRAAEGGGLLSLIVLIVIGWWIWGHWIHKPSWTAIYYPNAENLSSFIDQPVGSLRECRDWVSEQADSRGDLDYDYECGTNCKLQQDSTGKFYRCDETQE